jgi:hypothetical protein
MAFRFYHRVGMHNDVHYTEWVEHAEGDEKIYLFAKRIRYFWIEISYTTFSSEHWVHLASEMSVQLNLTGIDVQVRIDFLPSYDIKNAFIKF